MNPSVALDALESVKFAPTSSPLWQRLASLTNTLEGDARTALINEIAALVLKARDAEWLRCSALAYLTHDCVWLVRQAMLADDTSSPDAIMALLGLAWHQALVRMPERNAFAQLLQDIDAVRLQSLVAARISGGVSIRRGTPDSRLRVAIYTPEVGSSRHGGTMFTLNLISVLARQSTDLYAYTAKETTIPVVDSYHGSIESVAALAVEQESLKLNTSRAIQLMLPNTEFSLRSRFDHVLQAIDAYAPDVVVFVGFMSPLMYKLFARYPVVGLSVHALPPLAPVDVWLNADSSDDVVCWPGVPAPVVFPFPFRFWPKGPATPVDRATVGLAATATVLVTAGVRLHFEILPPWSERIVDFVEAHPDVHWLLIGVAKGKSLPGLPLHPRIHLIPPQLNLEAWLAMSDVYVNPPRMGGGGAVAMAMEQGLPVVTFTNNDGGDKVGACALSSDDEYFSQLAVWVTDTSARQQAGNEMQARFITRLDLSGQQAAKDLMQACHRAIESFKQRMGTSDA
ncbi:glycosyltransferase [Noviherbaspirillum saxi]|uniref:Glycosyl transferases group 1 n=1 Tax=Noviherbaspirillum saxi TaxID=2320863 RepID=A0A3A3FTD8_9BURK|nr:glycosyltransferase [Noviherbaspirillum saxi]RJF99487.1 hypothetical protein D3871_13850 [Noviherbaspirillum saxi]